MMLIGNIFEMMSACGDDDFTVILLSLLVVFYHKKCFQDWKKFFLGFFKIDKNGEIIQQIRIWQYLLKVFKEFSRYWFKIFELKFWTVLLVANFNDLKIKFLKIPAIFQANFFYLSSCVEFSNRYHIKKYANLASYNFRAK